VPNFTNSLSMKMMNMVLALDSGKVPDSGLVDLMKKYQHSEVTILRGNNLVACDFGGKSDPFCKFGVAKALGTWIGKPCKTQVISSTLNPTWNATASFDFAAYPNDQLIVEVWDKDPGSADPMGYVSLPVSSMRRGEITLTVKPMKKEKVSGTITIFVGRQYGTP